MGPDLEEEEMKKSILVVVMAITSIATAAVQYGLPPFYVPVVMRVYHTYSPCLEEGGA